MYARISQSPIPYKLYTYLFQPSKYGILTLFIHNISPHCGVRLQSPSGLSENVKREQQRCGQETEGRVPE